MSGDEEEFVRSMQARSCFHILLRVLGASKTSTLESLFHTRSQSTAEFWSGNSGRARKYKAGKHLPRDAFLASLGEELDIDLLSDVYQCLFRALITTAPIGGDLRGMLNSPACVHPVCIDFILSGLEPEAQSEEFGRSLNALPVHAGLGALGVSIVLLRHLHEKGADAEATLAAKVVFRLLLMLGPELHARGIDLPLLAFCVQRLFPAAGVEFLESADDMARMSAALSLVGHLPCGPEARSWKERVKIMAAVVRGYYPPLANLWVPTLRNGDLARARQERNELWRQALTRRSGIQRKGPRWTCGEPPKGPSHGLPAVLHPQALLSEVPGCLALFDVDENGAAAASWCDGLRIRTTAHMIGHRSEAPGVMR